jgi:hypothetical protein
MIGILTTAVALSFQNQYEELPDKGRWSLAFTMRYLRLLRDESIDEVGAQIEFRKSTISTCERYPQTASKRLRKALESHYGVPWRVLSQPANGATIAAVLVQSVKKDSL